MAKLPSIGLIAVPQPSISMACVLGTNTSVGARDRHCPLVFCDVKVNAKRTCRRIWPPRRHSRGNEPPEHPNRGSVPFLENTRIGGLGLQVILITISVFVLATNEANSGPQSLSSNEASTAKLEFGAKNRPKTQDTSAFRLEVAKP